MSQHTAIFVFSEKSFEHAKAISVLLGGTEIYATKRLHNSSCIIVDSIAEKIVEVFRAGRPILAFCAAGIIIRILSKVLNDKFNEPPVLCISEDGATVVPLLGGNAGANDLTYKIANFLGGYAAVTTSGALRFNINLLTPPDELELVNKEDVAAFISALLSGEKVKFTGQHDWLLKSALPFDDNGVLEIVIDETKQVGHAKKLVYHKKNTVNGTLTVVGLGPGDKRYMTYSAREALDAATDILGYDYYIKLAAPFASHQIIHPSDNREELARSQMALDLAAMGKKVVIVSSGDPGIFAMAAAIMECMEKAPAGSLDNVEIRIEPGITAAQSAAARLGAPLGHDFAVISLSDNLKPSTIIEKRIIASIQSDMALALYNPVSRARPKQIYNVFELIKKYCAPNTIIMIGTDIGREDEATTITTLEKLDIAAITSRSVILIGSSQTKIFRQGNKTWAYTPRSYPEV